MSVDAVVAHDAHLDGLDLIPAPDTCPGVPVPPPVTDVCPNLAGDQPVVPDLFDLINGGCVPEPDLAFVPCVVSAGVTQTATTVTGTPAGDGNDCSAASPGKTIDTFAGNDTITGTAFADVITSGDGNNTVGRLGDDIITAGTGSDALSGGPGNDNLVRPNNDSSVDTVSGGDGVNDVCTGPGLDFDIVSGCETQTP